MASTSRVTIFTCRASSFARIRSIKSQAPNPKSQPSNPSRQASIQFGVWVLGIWDLPFSPAASGEPALDLVEAVRSPERLAVDDDVGRPEHAALDRSIHFDAQPLL